jgi:hypothetical protein
LLLPTAKAARYSASIPPSHFSSNGAPVTDPTPKDFSQFLDQCLQELHQRHQAYAAQWGIDDCERWDVDQGAGTITFTNTKTGHKKLVGEVQIIGTFNEPDKMWHWSWANNSIGQELRGDALELKAYGEKNMRMRLSEPGWKGEMEDAWKMTALAVKLLGADAAYRGPAGQHYIFMVIRNLLPVVAE